MIFLSPGGFQQQTVSLPCSPSVRIQGNQPDVYCDFLHLLLPTSFFSNQFQPKLCFRFSKFWAFLCSSHVYEDVLLSWPLRDSGDHGPGLCLMEPRPASGDALAPTPVTRGSQESPAAPVFLAGPSCADLGRGAPRTLCPPRGGVSLCSDSQRKGCRPGTRAVGLRGPVKGPWGSVGLCSQEEAARTQDSDR